MTLQNIIFAPMSIWTRISEALAALTSGEGLSVVFDRLRHGTVPQRSVGFTIAIIALGAKMAKADGEVTRNEVSAFRQIFSIPRAEEANAARVFNLARQDVAGFDTYARKISAMFEDDAPPENRQVLIDLMEGLFHIAVADGNFHPGEDVFLQEVARIFGLDGRCFATLRARFVEGAARDSYQVLGVEPGATLDDIRAAWRQAVKNSHPDVMFARGVPVEAVKLAERRLIALNAAWADITARRAA